MSEENQREQYEKELNSIFKELQKDVETMQKTRDHIKRVEMLVDINAKIARQKFITGQLAIGPVKKSYLIGRHFEYIPIE